MKFDLSTKSARLTVSMDDKHIGSYVRYPNIGLTVVPSMLKSPWSSGRLRPYPVRVENEKDLLGGDADIRELCVNHEAWRPTPSTSPSVGIFYVGPSASPEERLAVAQWRKRTAKAWDIRSLRQKVSDFFTDLGWKLHKSVFGRICRWAKI